ncbi:oxidoreductase-like domain-containing protein [Chitinimonas taiwanensis]|uniref:oxidoreductase-like domain-containing protein n=1 Tax=Chitinimonas taiwanensis TaxID=240412 RepID=UPI000930392E|nr:oxidoreductase-like domain-containing protein [Chitinimonas taiwanensis]
MSNPPFSTDATDPRPIEPTPPESSECCNSGCDPCVFDLHNEEMHRYRRLLAEWEQRQQSKSGGSSAGVTDITKLI